MKFYSLVILFLLGLASSSCGGNGQSPLTHLAGQWNANAYQVHEHGASSSTIWLQPIAVAADGTITGSFRVQEFPGGAVTESGEFTGRVAMTQGNDEQMTLTFPPPPGSQESRTLGVLIYPERDFQSATGQATGWGFGADPQRSDFIFGMQKAQ
ncbi:MAG TPA: hypothetical protein VLE93_01400 [Candidatus Saccharimonadales bacterium]|nr:hypothetical protein [Candidatus Saccharimonadales bacterium]